MKMAIQARSRHGAAKSASHRSAVIILLACSLPLLARIAPGCGRNRATGVQAARRRPGEVDARRRSWITRTRKMVRHQPTNPAQTMDAVAIRPVAHPHPRAGGRGDGRRRGCSRCASSGTARWKTMRAHAQDPQMEGMRIFPRGRV